MLGMMYMDEYINVKTQSSDSEETLLVSSVLCLYLNVHFTDNVGQTVFLIWYQQVL